MLRYVLVFSLCVGCGAAALGDMSDLGAPGEFFTGSTSFDGVNLTGTVDYAVFWPGQFSGGDEGSTVAVPGFDAPPVPNPNDYVYAYQIFLGSPSAPVGTLGLNVEMASIINGVGMNNTGDDPGNWVPPSDAEVWDIPGFGAIHFEFDPQIQAGQTSYFLLFSSPFGPTWASASITDTGSSADVAGGLPSPVIPAPGAALLGAIGLGLIGPLKRRLS